MSDFKGNRCLLFIQKVLNLALFFVSFGFIVISIVLAVETRYIGVFQITFMILGVLELILASFAFSKNTSKTLMSCYVYTLLMLVGVQIVVSATAFVFKEKLIESIEKNSPQDFQAYMYFHNLVARNVNVALYCAIGSSVIQVLCLVMTACYKASMKRKSSLESGFLIEAGYMNMDPYRNISDRDAQEWLESVKTNAKAQYRYRNNNRGSKVELVY